LFTGFPFAFLATGRLRIALFATGLAFPRAIIPFRPAAGSVFRSALFTGSITPLALAARAVFTCLI
jgi:hypothetical protein